MIRATVRTAVLPALFLLLASLAVPPAAVAQRQADEPLPTVTRAIAIENARIVVAPGREIEGGTIVLRDGLIEAVGRGVSVPTDARRIAGDSLVVYAGFIDGLSTAGMPEEDGDGDRNRPERPGEPTYEQAGIQPHRKAASLLSPTHESIAALRNTGFAAAHVVPHGRSMPGTGAVILLGGDDARDMVLDDEASILMQFQSSRGVYPATDMAILARVRQLYRDAERRLELEQRYAEDPAGMARPPSDDVLRALQKVVSRETPVVFHTEGNSGALQIHRALALQQQLGFPMILAGANQAFDVVEPIRNANHAVFLTLALPDEPATKRDSVRDLRASTPNFDGNLRTRTSADVEAERDNLLARQAIERARYLATAADLHAAGITFGFSTRGAKPDSILKNVRTMVAHGLPSEAALAALTTNPARILGVDRHLGTLDEGKIANLVVADGSIFDDGTAIRHVFVDGVEYEVEQPRRSNGADTTQVNPAGEWAYRSETPDEATTGVLSMTRTNGALQGMITIDGRYGAIELDQITLSGTDITLRFSEPDLGTFTIKAAVDGDQMEGTLSVPERGTYPFSAQLMFGPSAR